MKTITLFSLALSLFSFSAYSQISKGAILLGGSISFSDNDLSSGSNGNFFSINPSLGFVIKENTAVGFNLSYGHGKSGSGSQISESNQYGGSLFYRKYMPLGKGFYLYGQGVAGTFYYKVEDHPSSNLQVQKRTITSLNLFPGIAYAVSKRFHLEIALSNMLSLSYATTKYEFANAGIGGPAESKSSELGFFANVNPSSDLALGFRILLGNK